VTAATVSSVRLASSSRAPASASGAGGYSGRGTAMTASPAAAAERSPLEESSTAAHDCGSTPSNRATVRYTSGAGLPRASSSVDRTAANAGRSPDASSTTAISDRGEELASPSVNREPSRRTASTAPGSSGRCDRYRPAIAETTTWATSSGDSRTPRSVTR